MKNKKNNPEEIFEIIANLHHAAHEYESSGLKPIDLIKSTDAIQEIDIHEKLGIEQYNFYNMSWGEACHFIITYSEYYSDQLKKFRADPISNSLH